MTNHGFLNTVLSVSPATHSEYLMIFRDETILDLTRRLEKHESERMVELEQLNKKMELVMDEKDHQLKVNRISRILNQKVLNILNLLNESFFRG